MHINHPEIAKKWDKEMHAKGEHIPKKDEHESRGMSDGENTKHWKKTGMKVPKTQQENHK